MKDEALLHISPAGHGQAVKMLITLETHGLFGSNFAYLYTRQRKKRIAKNRSTPRKMTSDGPVSLISMQRYVRNCCITHFLSLGVLLNDNISFSYYAVEKYTRNSMQRVSFNKRLQNTFIVPLDAFSSYTSKHRYLHTPHLSLLRFDQK